MSSSDERWDVSDNSEDSWDGDFEPGEGPVEQFWIAYRELRGSIKEYTKNWSLDPREWYKIYKIWKDASATSTVVMIKRCFSEKDFDKAWALQRGVWSYVTSHSGHESTQFLRNMQAIMIDMTNPAKPKKVHCTRVLILTKWSSITEWKDFFKNSAEMEYEKEELASMILQKQEMTIYRNSRLVEEMEPFWNDFNVREKEFQERRRLGKHYVVPSFIDIYIRNCMVITAIASMVTLFLVLIIQAAFYPDRPDPLTIEFASPILTTQIGIDRAQGWGWYFRRFGPTKVQTPLSKLVEDAMNQEAWQGTYNGGGVPEL